jgi:hypothetical protein
MSALFSTPDRISHLRALVDHPNTGPAEKEVAERMLARMIQRQAREQQAAGQTYTYPRWYGAKYDLGRGKTIVEIAALIRADIAYALRYAKRIKADTDPAAVKVVDPIADAPAQIKITVKQRNHSSIYVIVRNIPDDWGWVDDEDPHWGTPRKAASPALKALAAELREIWVAYNHDGSDIQSDYFDVRYYGGVQTEHGTSLR